MSGSELAGEQVGAREVAPDGVDAGAGGRDVARNEVGAAQRDVGGDGEQPPDALRWKSGTANE